MRLLSLAFAALLVHPLIVPAFAAGLSDLAPTPAQPQPGEPAPPPPPPPPPPPATDEKAEWYVAEGGASRGPFTLTQLRQAAQAGQIVASTQIYRAAEGWRAAKDVPELQGYVAVATTPPAPPPPPPLDTQKQLDKTMQQFIVGTWRFEGNIASGGYTAYVVIEVTYRDDGSLAGYQSLQLPGYGNYQPPPTVTELKGRYTITGIDAENFTLTTTLVGSQGNTSKLKIVDRNTVENQADGARSYRVR